MQTRTRISLAGLLLLAIMVIMHWAFILMNMPNDFTVAGGILIMLLIFIGGPNVFRLILKGKKKVNEPIKPQEPSIS